EQNGNYNKPSSRQYRHPIDETQDENGYLKPEHLRYETINDIHISKQSNYDEVLVLPPPIPRTRPCELSNNHDETSEHRAFLESKSPNSHQLQVNKKNKNGRHGGCWKNYQMKLSTGR
ncbi:unnamed protein product, partial [Owenia fusiformis]